jgi:uncharacterized membrane protein YhaH (DUF805 family)
MEVEYEITADDLFAFHWRAAFGSPRAQRARRRTYLYWFLALLVMTLLPAISSGAVARNFECAVKRRIQHSFEVQCV